jgi:hypothetical protein
MWKVSRVRNKWKCTFKDGMIHINGKDYLFAKCTGLVLFVPFRRVIVDNFGQRVRMVKQLAGDRHPINTFPRNAACPSLPHVS